MRIGFDVRPFLRQETGVGVYFRNLLFSLAGLDKINEYYLFSCSVKDRFLPEKIPPFRHLEFRDFRYPVRGINWFWHHLRWPPLDRFFKAPLDLTHSPVPLLIPTDGKTLVTVHDLFFMDFPGKVDPEARRHFVRRIGKSLRLADGIIAVSRFIREQIVNRFGIGEDKIRVIHHGLDRRFTATFLPDEKDAVRRKYTLPESFFLFVGAVEPRKNLTTLLEAFRILRRREQNLHLVIVGREGGDEENLNEKIRRLGLGAWVKRLEYVPDKDLMGIYRLASAFVFPSACEGFGIPLLEAMASGLPLAVADTSALPEVAQDSAAYFRPDSPEEMAEQMYQVLRDSDLRARLVSAAKTTIKQFDWDKAARETLDFYAEITGDRR